MCESLELFNAEGCVIVHEVFVRWTTLEEHRLQLMNHASRVLPRQLLPNGETQWATVCKHYEMAGTVMCDVHS